MSSPLIGREHPFGVLRDELGQLLDGRGGLALVTGEAGIGKTTLVAELAAQARRCGARVLNGSCWDGDGVPDYWPWIQVTRNLARAASTGEWTAAAEAAGDGLPALLGETGPAAGPAYRPASADSAAFRLHDSFTRLLVTAAQTQPTVVVLDDLHWADPASLRLLDFVARHARFEPILFVGTYRDVEIDAPNHPLRSLLLPLLPQATTVRLTGLSADEVGALIARTTGAAPDAERVAEVFRRTGGNPFFVEQSAQLSGEPVAAGVRDAIKRRLAPLPAPVVRLLRAASVLGQEFDPVLLGAAAGVPPAEVDGLLELAATTRLVSRTDSGRYTFNHDLVREFLYSGLNSERRRAVHAAMVRALRNTPAASAGALAYHARLAVPALDRAEATELLLAAARDAGRRLAAEEAVRHYRATLTLALPEQRPVIELELAVALDRAGALETSRETFWRVIAAARERDDGHLMARAALGLHRLGNPSDPGDNPRSEITLMDEARSRLGATSAPDPALTARVLAAASMARTHQAVEYDTATELGKQAVALARQRGDDDTLGWCLLALHDAIWQPNTAEARIEVLDELTSAARRANDRELESLASFLRTLALFELGDPSGYDEFAVFEGLTERTRLPRHRFLAVSRRGTLTALTGQFEQAQQAFDAALVLGEQVGETDRVRVWRDQVWAMELLRGDFSAAEAALASTPGDPFPELLAAFLPSRRVTGLAAHELLAHLEPTLRQQPRRFGWLWQMLQAHVAAASGDDELCARARAALAPALGRWVVISGGLAFGPVAYWAGLLDAAQRRWDDAVANLTAAAASADQLRARPWAVRARARLAAALVARQAPGDAEAAVAELDWARRAADEMGMTAALDAPRFADPAPPVPRLADPTPRAADQHPNVFRCDGQVWTLRYADRTVHMRDAKGLHDLHTLLGSPGTDIPATQLFNPAGDPAVRHSSQLGADPMLDEQARAAYQGRLRRIDVEIQDALDRGDDDQAAKLDEEREALLDELRRATGLGGRSRRLGDDTERARQAVTARIRDSLRRLRSLHPELAEHLDAAVSTGIRCRYQPTSEIRWSR